jgi:HK97 gp10 family phage protein
MWLMPDGGSVTVTGLDEMRRAIDAFPKAVEQAFQDTARTTANTIAQRARLLVPVGTGRTQRSIRVVEDLAHHAYHVEVGPHAGMPGTPDWPAHLPIWLEYGTRHMAARPFMRPALDAERERYRQRLEWISAQIAEQVFR